MPTIGSFSHDDLFGQEGTLETSTLKAKIKFVPLRDRSGKQPDYRILLGKREVGAAWSRTSKSGGEYLFLCCISVRDVARRQRGPLPAEPPISASGNRHPSANATYARCIASASGWGGAGPTSASVSRAGSRPRGSKGPWGSTLSEDLA